jgi:hypothetical protein
MSFLGARIDRQAIAISPTERCGARHPPVLQMGRIFRTSSSRSRSPIGRYSIGPSPSISVADLRSALKETLALIEANVTPEKAAEIVAGMRAIWGTIT